MSYWSDLVTLPQLTGGKKSHEVYVVEYLRNRIKVLMNSQQYNTESKILISSLYNQILIDFPIRKASLVFQTYPKLNSLASY